MVTAGRSGKVRNAQIFSATSAEGAGLWRKLRTAEIADGGAGETQEGTATKGTGAGKQCTREAVRGTSQHTHNSPPNRSLRQRDVESQGNTLTRKDAPHSRPARLAAALPPMARVYGQVKGERHPCLRGLLGRFTRRNPLAGNGGSDAGHHQCGSCVLQRRWPLLRQP